MELAEGTLLAHRYRIHALLGEGGAAEAYLAEDLLEGEQVALKLLTRDRPHEELRREFERLRGFVHPHLVRVRDFTVARTGGRRRALYTSTVLEGGALRVYARAHPEQRVRLCGDVLAALHVLHRVGLRHGDVKPENVLVDANGRAVLIDLGCAAPLGSEREALFGTYGYLAPELLAGRAADERADLYAFGVLMRELELAEAYGPLIARLTAERASDRPSSAREVLTLLGDRRDVELGALGRTGLCLGREQELAQVQRVLACVARGEQGPRCVWIEGAPGVGRTRFLHELRHQLACAEIDVVEARAQAALPVREAFARRDGALDPGFEPLLEHVRALGRAREPCVILLDDAERLSGDAADELAFVRRALPASGRLALVIASTRPPDGEDMVHLRLQPLAPAALARWAEGVVADSELAAFGHYTGGYPRYVARALRALAEGRLRVRELPSAEDVDDQSLRVLRLAIEGLSRAAQRALARVAVGIAQRAEVPESLFTRDLVVERGGSVALAREADRAPLLRLLHAETVREVRLEAAEARSRVDDAAACAEAVEHLLALARSQEAQQLLVARRALALRAPGEFVRRLAPHADLLPSSELLELAALARLSGAARLALSLLARAKRRTPELATAREAAEVYLALGNLRRARSQLARAAAGPWSAELAARLLVREGAYEEARALATEQLTRGVEATLRPKLLETQALAAAYLGEFALAKSALGTAFALHGSDDLRSRARNRALDGFVALRAGAAREAIEAYGEAHELAERAGLADLVLNALTNLASARQGVGLWGSAMSTYERALRLAVALGRRASVRTVRLNLANLALEIGTFERARSELEGLGEGDSAALATSARLYRAELALLEGDAQAALAGLQPLIDAGANTPSRERSEALALALSAHVSRGDRPRVEALLEQLHAQPLTGDLEARGSEACAAALHLLGRTRDAMTRLEASYAALRERADPALLARLESALAESCRALGAAALAREHARRARANWERIALDLPRALRDAFWNHPRRRTFAESGSVRPPNRTSSSLSRVRELNRRIGALHTPDEVLAFAIDAAIELTGAERGFVLLARGDNFEVAVAREMDRTRTPKREWKWSRSIAERVIREGQPVLTVDAGRDPRFARNPSVHAMQLKSVLCAPIRAKSGVIGALYLDNRLSRARFAEDDSEVLLTFADQVAIALRHAELVRELEQRAHELAREKRKVEELARGQARELERLSEQLSTERAAWGQRYDYRNIVGRSEPMRRVLSLLDRVIDSDLNVLVQGESGTGKELVARAIHMHGARKERPFVSVNCAALPEQLLESELFGHVRGAFTGAHTAREGLFVRARGGTLFLDELGEMPLAMQAKLLRALNDGEVRPVGASKSFAVDVRVVCASNKNLKRCVASGEFREDLYYRVSVVEITLPPLRERHEDIVPIAEAILARRAHDSGSEPLKLAADAVRALLGHGWPGNVRELQNVLLRASVMAQAGEIRARDLELSPSASAALARSAPATRDEWARKEAERLLSALESERWNVSKVAKNLGIPRNTLYRKLSRYGIQRQER